MILRKLRVAGFRGFNLAREFSFNMGLNTMYGPNGLGKTSVAEALEWLFFGETSKLRFARSKMEFRNSLRNLHYQGPGNPFAEAELCLPSGNNHIVRRELIADDTSQLFLDGVETGNLDSLGVYEDTSPVPVVAQHALKEFIHSEPAKRWDVISKMLGLEALSGFRASLTTAVTQFKNANSQALGAVAELSSSLKGKPALQSLAPLAKALDTLNSTKFDSEVEKITTAIFGSKPEDALSSLLAERLGLTDSLVALPTAIAEAAVTSQTSVESARATVRQVVQSAERFSKVYPQYVVASGAQLLAERIALLKQGLDLIEHEDLTCPFCGEPTLTPGKRATLQAEVNSHERLHVLHSEASSEVRTLAEQISKLIPAVAAVVPPQVPEGGLQGWSAVLQPEVFSGLLQLGEQIAQMNTQFATFKTDISIALASIQDDFKHRRLDQANLATLLSRINAIIQVIEVGERLRVQAAELQSKAIPYLQHRALANERVEQLDALIRILRNDLIIREACGVQTVIQRMTSFKKKTEEHEKEKTAERLAGKDAGVLKWYGVLNPNEEVRFAHMGLKGSGARQIDLLAELYGKTANAVAMLSEAHINATGLSVYLAQIVTSYSPFRFIVLDDPVQSMDADHTFRLQTDLISQLLAQGYQVVVLSHLRMFIDDVRLHHDRNLEFDYEFASYERNGPVIVERGPDLMEYLREAQSLRKGGSLQRTTALHILRKALERMCKLAYTKATGKELPAKYESITSRQLKELVKGVISPEDIGKVSLILKYGDPASHDGSKLEPPTEGMIDSMISQVTNLIVKHVEPEFRRP